MGRHLAVVCSRRGNHPLGDGVIMTTTEETKTGLRYQHYDSAGRAYSFTARQVQGLVKKHGLLKRKVWGQMAVESSAWEALAAKEGWKLAPGYGEPWVCKTATP